MKIRELIMHLHEAILQHRLSGNEQVLIPDICTQVDPVRAGETEPVSTTGVLEFADGTRALLLINTTRADAILLRETLLRKP